MPYADRQKQLEYQNQWMQKRRTDWLAANGPCARCGSWKDLEVDHIDRRQKVSHRIWSWTEARRNEELKKCQVLCGECHKKKTAEDHRAAARHGTYAMRNRYGCRCEECLEYVRRNKRESRARLGYN